MQEMYTALVTRAQDRSVDEPYEEPAAEDTEAANVSEAPSDPVTEDPKIEEETQYVEAELITESDIEPERPNGAATAEQIAHQDTSDDQKVPSS